MNTPRSVKLYAPDGSELMEITSLERNQNDLVVKGKIMGAMPMTAVIRPDQARNVLTFLNWRLVLFLLSLLFRRGV